MKKNTISKFPKGFFSTLNPNTIKNNQNSSQNEKPFKWSKNVLNGNSKVKLVSLKK